MPRLLLVFAILFTPFLQPSTNLSPAQPAQVLHGPGGREYTHQVVTKAHFGEGSHEYWLYEPDRPRPASAPLIVFFHGWGATNPAIYGAWIEHLVRRGNIVVFPRYQAELRTPMGEFTENSIFAIKDAIRRLETDAGHVKPDLARFAVVGHSVGGLLTANIAALASESGLPKVRAMMSVEPAITWNPIRTLNVPLADLGKIPGDTLLLTVAGDSDALAQDKDAKRIYYESKQVPAGNKNFVTLVSDSHGEPPLTAGHHAAVAPNKDYNNGDTIRGAQPQPAGPGGSGMRGQSATNNNNRDIQGSDGTDTIAARAPADLNAVDALDYYGLWKLFDALCDASFFGKNREYALGNTPQERFMGLWSDGVAVKELIVTDKP